ncbi:MAG: hypothetical protein AB7G75_16945 [Candidatus Binatia bacterium]
MTISANSLFRTGYATYDYRGNVQGNHVSLRASAFQVSSEKSLSLAAEGDLSQEEVASINRLLANVEQLGKCFFALPVEELFSIHGELKDCAERHGIRREWVGDMDGTREKA